MVKVNNQTIPKGSRSSVAEKSNYELSQSIRNNRKKLKSLKEDIKNKSIKKNLLISRIGDEVAELTSRFNKKKKVN